MRRPEDHELTGHGVAHDYLASYPSGQRLRLRGVFAIVAFGGLVPGVRAGERLWILDPRALITRGDLVIYDPRLSTELPAWAAAWLAEHPEWPAVALDGAVE